MNCQELRDYLLNTDTDRPLSAEAATHLKQCPSCRAYLRQLNAGMNWLKTQPAPAIPPEITKRLQRRLFQKKSKNRLIPALSLAVVLVIFSVWFTLQPSKQNSRFSANEFNIEFLEYRGHSLSNLNISLNKNFINVFVSGGGKNHE